jgi:adenylate cyclase class IV
MTNTSKNIEIELRSRFQKEKYDEVLAFLEKNAKHLGTDDKRVWFFILPNKLLKVTHNLSMKNGKITLKLNKIGHGSSFEEIEFPIEEEDIDKAVRLFSSLGYEHLFEPKILRRNFEYKGIEFAIKYSKTWEYHLELEVMISSKEQQKQAEDHMREVANELNIPIMTEEELLLFTQNIEETYVHQAAS